MNRRHVIVVGAVILVVAVVLAVVANLVFQPGTAGAPTSAIPATSGPRPAAQALPIPPTRDLYALTQRFKVRSSEPISRGIPIEQETVGQSRTFWVTNLSTEQYFQVNATLRALTDHVAMYIQDGSGVNDADVQRSADDFEQRIYPCVRDRFGSEWPATGPTGRLTVFTGNVPGVAGYYSSADEYPQAVNDRSNQRKMFYLNSGAIRLGTPQFIGTMAHEFQHMIHWNNDRGEQTWVNEGLSELAADLCGNGAGFVAAFTGNPNVQLNAWGDTPNASGPYYGGAFLFMKYLSGRFGPASLRDLVSDPATGIAGIDSWARRRGANGFEELFKDWVVANFLNESTGKYGYNGYNVRINPTETIDSAGKRDGTVKQYAARYYDLRLPNDATLRFSGAPSVKLIAADAKSGQSFWYSNRGDNIDSTLTREVDLTNATRATLNFSMWHDLEENWDYTYISASTDGGTTWNILPATRTTANNPVGSNFGVGWTGKTNGWVDERVDLSVYAGKKVQIRFESITDDAVNREGFAIDDLAIPEIGWTDDAEQDRDWTASGFARVRNDQPQPFLVQIIRFDQRASVETVTLAADNTAEIRLSGGQRAVLVVSGAAPITTRDAAFSFTIEPGR